MLPVKYNQDGSLDIYLQHANPGPDKEPNWLPAPLGPLGINMPLYAPHPRPSTVDGPRVRHEVLDSEPTVVGSTPPVRWPGDRVRDSPVVHS